MNPKQLDKVALVARAEQNRAAQKHQRGQEQLSASQQRLGQLEQFRAEYESRLESLAGSGIDARQLADYRRFLASLNDAISRQGEEVSRSESTLRDSRDELQERSRRRDSVDQLVERTRAALLKEGERREQRRNDDSSLEQHQRSGGRD